MEQKKTMKWEVKHDIAKKVIDHFLDNAGYWRESEILAGGLSEEEKNIVSEEIELMITSIRRRYKLQERLPQNSEEKPIKTEIQEVVKKPETVVVPEQQVDKPKPKRIRKTSDTEKEPATRKPRAKKIKAEE